MSANLWVEQFRGLHARARKGQLGEEEKRRYAMAREQFARALTAEAFPVRWRSSFTTTSATSTTIKGGCLRPWRTTRHSA